MSPRLGTTALVLLPDSHVTIGTIQQTQDATNLLWVYRHTSRHAAWPTVILRFIECRWKTRRYQHRIWLCE